MDSKRFILALILTALVIFGTQFLFPPPTPPAVPPAAVEPTGVQPGDPAVPPPGEVVTPAPPPPAVVAAPVPAPVDTPMVATVVVPDTIRVNTPLVQYEFSSVGAMPIGAVLPRHESLARPGAAVQLARTGVPLITLKLLAGRDTLHLDRTPFQVEASPATETGEEPLTFRAEVNGVNVAITYTFAPDSYLVRVRGDVEGVAPPATYLVLTMPHGMRSEETNIDDDRNHFGYVLKRPVGDADNVPFAKLDTMQRRVEVGPFVWVASKTKYFVVGALTGEREMPPFSAVTLWGETRAGRVMTDASAATLQGLRPDGSFEFELYTGPQEWRRLRALGRDFVNVNPIGGFMRPIVQPFSTIVMRVLLWMHDTLQLTYGWVLIIFGIVVRLLLWPLNQKAMRTSLRMQRLQPYFKEIQEKHKDNPQRLQQEMMRLYKEHDMSPFSMLGGCLPMLIPMPVLIALFFVFQNTIEFRGVSFLWMSDISQHDPIYILPVVMGASMFLMSWIGMRNAPPNPQAKLMAYVFPAVFTFIFLRFAAGLNLYYAVQNIAALPQQWLIAKERAKVAPAPTKKTPAKAAPARR